MHVPRVLVVTRLFPNAAEPLSAPFNRRQMVALSKLCDVRVLGVLPWFPGVHWLGRFSAAARTLKVPRDEIIDGLPVQHPRVLYVPKVGLVAAPLLYAGSIFPGLAGLKRQADVLLACWAFPDGVATVALGRLLGLPVVVKVHGTDVNDLVDRPTARPWARWLLPQARRVVAVNTPLADRVRRLGVASRRVVVVENGVDRSLFFPRDRAVCRRQLKIPEDLRLILYVGALKASKGACDTLSAFEKLSPHDPALALAMVGAGNEMQRCHELARRIPGRVFVTGALPPEAVALWMGAADILTLPSWNEGTPNVILEALASGRPVVASAVGGIPDVIRDTACGVLVPARDPDRLAMGWMTVLGRSRDPERIASFAPGDWAHSGRQLFEVLEQAIREPVA